MKKIQYVVAKSMKIFLNPPALNNCKKDKTARICAKSELTNCNIGRYSYVGSQCFMVNTNIGRYCSIADRCSIGGASHPVEYVSTSPVFCAGRNILNRNFFNHELKKTPETIIENDVWIGQGVFIKAGIKISTGAVIGMGSVVTHDVGPYEIWAGNPAKMIKKRFDKDLIAGLMKSRWWEWSNDRMSKYAMIFNDPKKFLETIRLDKD